MRREKGMPLGGPCGGSGGRGGDVVLLADKTINTLSGARQKVHYRGAKGTNGVGKGKDGMHARDTVVKVPLGTIVRLGAGQDGPVCGEVRRGVPQSSWWLPRCANPIPRTPPSQLNVPGQTLVVSRGGRGGRGNQAFKTPQNRAPRLMEYGVEPLPTWIRLDLKLVGDVGVVGLPNAGKSTLLSR
jgi:GTP-binding protein